MQRAVIPFFLFGTVLATALGQSHVPQSNQGLTVSALVKSSNGAVVQIVTADQDGKEFALGSGFFVSTDGKIVTNYHVIEGAHSAVAKLSNGSFFPIEGAIAVDADRDLVLLKVEGRSLPFLNLGSMASLQVGDHVVAIGSPLGLEGTVSDGIVSALRSEAQGKDWIQTTAPVSHGNSGGPLLDMSGDVVGVITWGVSLQQGQNLNFAIPSDEIAALLPGSTTVAPLESVSKMKRIETVNSSPAPPPALQAATNDQETPSRDDNGQHAIGQLRAIAEAIKTCPPNVYKLPATLASLDFIETYGPPTNVVWDVEPNDSVRAKYLGTINYVFPVSDMPPDEDVLCNSNKRKTDREQCRIGWEVFMQRYQRADAHPWQFRLEFDVTSNGLDFSRSFAKQKQIEGEPWVPGGIEVCAKRAIHLVLNANGPTQ